MPALVRHMAALVDGLDVASGGELRVALDAGIDPRDDQLRRPGKSDAELRAGGRRRHPGQRRVDARDRRCSRRCRAALQLPARVAVRVNPDFELKSSGMKMGGGPSSSASTPSRCRRCSREIGALGLEFEGFHIFSGSQNLRADAICEAQRKAVELALRLRRARAGAGAHRSTSAAASAFRTSRASSRSTSRRSAPTCTRLVERAARELPRRAARDRARPLPGRRGRHLRVPRHRPQGFARPGVPRHRRRPAPSSGRVGQLRPGDPQELSGGHRQPGRRRGSAKSHRSSARCARRSTCSPTAWSWPRRAGRSGRRVPVRRLRRNGEPAAFLSHPPRRNAGLSDCCWFSTTHDVRCARAAPASLDWRASARPGLPQRPSRGLASVVGHSATPTRICDNGALALASGRARDADARVTE